jgi:hypothetical protein
MQLLPRIRILVSRYGQTLDKCPLFGAKRITQSGHPPPICCGETLLQVDVVECRIGLRKFFYLAPFVRIFKVSEEEDHAKAEPAEPNAVFDGLSPEELAAQFFGGGSVCEPQEGLTGLEWLKGQFKTKSAAIQYLHSDRGGAHPPKVIAKHIAVKRIGSIFPLPRQV